VGAPPGGMGHFVAHAPQCSGSVLRSMHCVPQRNVGSGQGHSVPLHPLVSVDTSCTPPSVPPPSPFATSKSDELHPKVTSDEAISKQAAKRILKSYRFAPPRAHSPGGVAIPSRELEEIPDGELEDARVFVGQRAEGEAPLEAQRAEGREPADAEAVRG